jgi:hypothetical protein
VFKNAPSFVGIGVAVDDYGPVALVHVLTVKHTALRKIVTQRAITRPTAVVGFAPTPSPRLVLTSFDGTLSPCYQLPDWNTGHSVAVSVPSLIVWAAPSALLRSLGTSIRLTDCFLVRPPLRDGDMRQSVTVLLPAVVMGWAPATNDSFAFA